MAKKLFLVLVVAAVAVVAFAALHDRGSGGTTPPASTTTTATTAPTMTVKAYFLQDNGLVPVTVDVPQTPAVAKAALEALLAGPPAGYQTAIPAGTKLGDVTLIGFAATVDLPASLSSLTRTAQAQVVDTLTQFPTVQSVAIDAAASPVTLSNSVDQPLGRPATATDYADLAADAPIFVQAPARDSTVTSPVTVSGTAVVFEATFVVEVHAGGKLLGTHPIDTSVGAPERGTWSTTLDLPAGPVQLFFYEPSAEDGSHLHPTEVDLNVTP